MELKRVVVTGIGTITPLGNNLDDYWNGLINGVSGADMITQFDAAKLNLAQLMEREPSIDFDVVVPATTDLEIISSAYSSMEVLKMPAIFIFLCLGASPSSKKKILTLSLTFTFNWLAV